MRIPYFFILGVQSVVPPSCIVTLGDGNWYFEFHITLLKFRRVSRGLATFEMCSLRYTRPQLSL
jgi:hypothetical protein